MEQINIEGKKIFLKFENGGTSKPFSLEVIGIEKRAALVRATLSAGNLNGNKWDAIDKRLKVSSDVFYPEIILFGGKITSKGTETMKSGITNSYVYVIFNEATFCLGVKSSYSFMSSGMREAEGVSDGPLFGHEPEQKIKVENAHLCFYQNKDEQLSLFKKVTE